MFSKRFKPVGSLWLGAAMLLVASCSRDAGAKKAPQKPQMPPAVVSVEKVAMIDRGEPRRYVASTSPYALVDIVARVSGTMTKDDNWKEGGNIKAGQLLYAIEDTVYDANVKSAEANVISAKASVEQIKAELAFAQKEFDRQNRLLSTKATSQTSYESALRTLNTCKARLSSADGSLKAAEAALILAKNDLSYTKIYSPVGGRIGKSIYSSGNYITPSKGALATVVQFDPIKLRFAMSEADYLNYKRKKSLPEVELFAADGKKIENPAKLDFVDNLVDTGTGTVMIQFLVSNPDEMLIPNGYATVYLYEKFEKPVASVSVSALMTDGKDHFVYVVGAGNVPERRKVRAGVQVGDRQVILDGLKAGETVISAGIHKVRPDKPVVPVPAKK